MIVRVKQKDLAAVVQEEFRRHGFRADGPTIIDTGRDGRTYDFEFADEPATGQVAFSQKKVTCHCRVWADGQEEAGFKCDRQSPIALDLEVSYQHWGGGSNGFSNRYHLTAQSFSEEARLDDIVLSRA
jgi:hypothetical protein